MSRARDKLLKRDDDLSRTEHMLQFWIQHSGDWLSKAFSFTGKTKQQLRSYTAGMRHKMRTLRKWRSGAEPCSSRDLRDFLRDIRRLRLETIDVKTTVLLDTLDRVDGVLSAAPRTSDDVACRRDSAVCELTSLRHQLSNVESSDEDEIGVCENRICSLETDVLRLLSLVEEATRTQGRRGSNGERSAIAAASLRFEDNPEANRVLRNVSRNRKLMKLLRDGGHMTIAGSPNCVANDIEVLERQLYRMEQWRKNEIRFSKNDLDDVEVIFTAIASHLKPELDVDGASTTISGSSISRSGSSNSDRSTDPGYPSSSPLAFEAPPLLAGESGVKEPSGFYNRENIDDTADDIVDERLI